MPVKPKGTVLAEFVAEGKTVRARYKSDHLEWVTITCCRTIKHAQALASQLNQAIGAIENNG